MKKARIIFLLISTLLGQIARAQSDFNDVASIFYTRCTSCHHDGGGAGFSLLTFNDVSAYTSTIQNELITDHMPPWLADTSYTTGAHPVKRFLHENTITSVEKNAILQWINDNSLEGNPALLPKAPIYDNTKFKLNGTSSLDIQIPTFSSNSTGNNPASFNCFSIPTGLTQDRWLQAFEILPSNLDAVHDVLVTIDTSGSISSDLSGNATYKPGEIFIGSWVTGSAPTIFPNQPSLKAGVRIPAGSHIIFQIHNTHGSGGLLDSTKIRLFFYPQNETGIRPIHSEVFLQYWGIGITSNTTKSITVTPSNQLHVHPQQPVSDISLFSLLPHSNNICTEIEDFAYNGSDTIPLIRINEWYYLWQGQCYYFPNLVKIPASYTLTTNRFFDNTFSNQHQPNNPLRNINFGTTANDEMIYDTFQWMDYQAGDELLNIKALVANDTLLKVGINEIYNASELQSYIYPNPASDKLNISVSKRSEYMACIYDIRGQKIMQTATFNQTLMVDVKNIPAGLYIIEITDTASGERITKKIVLNN